MILRPFLLRRTIHLSPLRHRPLLLTSAFLGFSLPFLNPGFFPTLLDTSPQSFSTTSSSPYTHSRDARTPLTKEDSKSINPAAVKQISLGSILGLGAGVLVSTFSRTLTLLLGVGIVVVQVCQAFRDFLFVSYVLWLMC